MVTGDLLSSKNTGLGSRGSSSRKRYLPRLGTIAGPEIRYNGKKNNRLNFKPQNTSGNHIAKTGNPKKKRKGEKEEKGGRGKKKPKNFGIFLNHILFFRSSSK